MSALIDNFRTMSSRNEDRLRIIEETKEFLARGGKVKQLARATNITQFKNTGYGGSISVNIGNTNKASAVRIDKIVAKIQLKRDTVSA